MHFRSQNEKHLVAFLQETFGELLSIFLLSGLGEEGWAGERFFTVSLSAGQGAVEKYRLEMISDGDTSLPNNLNPLVLAAMLKMLLEHGETCRLACRQVELMKTLGWDDSSATGKAVLEAVERYYALSIAGMPYAENQLDSTGVTRITRLLVEYETREVKTADEMETNVCVSFNPEIIEAIKKRRLLGIDWNQVVAIEV
jgi:hypothetical protein